MAKKPAAEETPAATASEGTISKMEAVRRAIAEGVDKPQDAVSFIKERFGLEITTAIVSSYKSAINAKKGTVPGKRGRKAKEPGIVGNDRASMGTTAVKGSPAADSNGLHLAKEVKALVGKYGADAVKGMADIFAE